MSGQIVAAEAALARCVAAMRNALLSSVAGAMPQSTAKDAMSDASGALVDTAAQRLEWERAEERRRIARVVAALDEHFAALEAAAAALPDAPIDALDAEAARLGTENAALAHEIIAAYDEAEAVAARIEQIIMAQPMPSI